MTLDARQPHVDAMAIAGERIVALANGNLADLVVLWQDILTIPTPKILATDVVMAIVGGKIANERKK